MTTNAILTYLGVALVVPAAMFLLFGVSGLRRQSISTTDPNVGPPRPVSVPSPTRRANLAAGVLLFAASMTVELISLTHGGAAAGEPSGNAAGGIVAIALLTCFCLIGSLSVRQFILGHYSRVLNAQSKRPRQVERPVIRLRV
jgi:hypothetical protein